MYLSAGFLAGHGNLLRYTIDHLTKLVSENPLIDIDENCFEFS